MDNSIKCSVAEPYPPVQVCGPNPSYAKAMLFNVGSCISEMSAISLYIYNSIAITDSYPDAADLFHRISIVEMRHLNIFGQLAALLGADPRLWRCTNRGNIYWNPGYNEYPREIASMIRYAISGEKKTIDNYRRQASWINDPNIVASLNRIILDEEYHNKLLQALYDDICS